MLNQQDRLNYPSPYRQARPVQPQSPAAGNDRVLLITRILAAFIVPFLLVAFAILYIFPDNTTELFAWTILPRMTPMMLGATYIGGAYFFVRVITASRWHRVKLGFWPVTFFAAFLGIASVLHWDRFNHSHISFIAWISLYLTTPLLVPAVWFLNRKADPGLPESGDAYVPVAARWAICLMGAGGTALGLLLFLTPDLMVTAWPWTLTPLTSRVLGAMFMLTGVVGLGFARDPRWSSIRIVLESQLVSIVFILLAVGLAWNNFNPANPLTWGFVATLVLILAGEAGLYVAMERQRRQAVRVARIIRPSSVRYY